MLHQHQDLPAEPEPASVYSEFYLAGSDWSIPEQPLLASLFGVLFDLPQNLLLGALITRHKLELLGIESPADAQC